MFRGGMGTNGRCGAPAPRFSSAPSPCPCWGFALMLWTQVPDLHPASQAGGGCWSVVMLRDPGPAGRRTSAWWDLTGLLKGGFCRDNLMPYIQTIQRELSVGSACFLLHSNMHLEAIVSVKIGEYGSNLFMEISHIDKNTLSIAYNYI